MKEYRDDILYPVSFDEAGVKAQVRVFFDAAEMQAKATPPEELKKIIQERYKRGHYKSAGTGGRRLHAVSDPQNLRKSGSK